MRFDVCAFPPNSKEDVVLVIEAKSAEEAELIARTRGYFPFKATVSSDALEATRTCPYCAETIKAKATLCRFCQMDVSSGRSMHQFGQPAEVQARSSVADGVKLGCGMFIVLPILLGLGLLFLSALLASS